MTDEPANTSNDELDAWLRPLMEEATGNLGVKPAWALPGQILIGKVRAHGNPANFRWFICGETPLDHVGDDVAASPRDAARHFSLKWQLDATRLGGEAAETLARQAEALYALVDDDRWWHSGKDESSA